MVNCCRKLCDSGPSRCRGTCSKSCFCRRSVSSSSLCLWFRNGGHRGGTSFARASPFLLLLMHFFVIAAVMTLWFPQSDSARPNSSGPCDTLAILMDTIGLVSARLARLNLGISLVLSSRGVSSWVLGASASQLGVAESIPLHRVAGWWCVFQSVLHSVSYFLFYLETGGATSLWLNCFPATYDDATLMRANLTRVDYPLNTMGLVNFLAWWASWPQLFSRCLHFHVCAHAATMCFSALTCRSLPYSFYVVHFTTSPYCCLRCRAHTRANFVAHRPV